MGDVLYGAGALVLLMTGIEALIRTIRVEAGEMRRVSQSPERHGGADRIRQVFAGRLALNLIEPLLALILGSAALWVAFFDIGDPWRAAVPMCILPWLLVRFYLIWSSPPAVVIALALLIAGQFL